MQAEVFLIFQVLQYGVRQVAKPYLQCVAILYQLRNIVPDAPGNFIRLVGIDGLDKWFFVRDQPVNFVYMNKAVSPSSGHARVDLGNDRFCMLHARPGDVHGHPEAAESILVGWTHLNQCGVQPDPVTGEESRNLREVGRDVFDLAIECGLSNPMADKKNFDEKSTPEIFIFHVVGKGERQHLVDHDVL